ncbi:MAG: hypothetical protein ABEN55_15100, partial [Bradymonadaceae bacterium]
GETIATLSITIRVESLTPLEIKVSTTLRREASVVAQNTTTLRTRGNSGAVSRSTFTAGDLTEVQWLQVGRRGTIKSITFGKPLEPGESPAGETRAGAEATYDVVTVDLTGDFDPNKVESWRRKTGLLPALARGDSALFR